MKLSFRSKQAWLGPARPGGARQGKAGKAGKTKGHKMRMTICDLCGDGAPDDAYIHLNTGGVGYRRIDLCRNCASEIAKKWDVITKYLVEWVKTN